MAYMMNEVKAYSNVLTSVEFEQLRAYVRGLPFCQPTPVFSVITGQDIIDSEIRSSLSVSVDDPIVMAFVKKTLLARLAVTDERRFIIKLARDSVTFIKYTEGGHFDWHADHEKYIINERRRWLECHLIFCIEAPEEGGELLIEQDWPSSSVPKGVQESSISYEANMCCLFDKNLRHRAEPVRSGTKIIMTVDVLVGTEATAFQNMDLEVEPYIKQRQSFITHNPICLNCLSDDDRRSITMFQVVLFDRMYARDGQPATDSTGIIDMNRNILVHDSTGLRIEYSKSKQDCDIVYEASASRTNSCSPTELQDRVVNEMCALDGVELHDVITCELSAVSLNGAKPLPKGYDLTDLKAHLGTLPRIHVRAPIRQVNYTFHCNEPNYGQMAITQLVVVLFD